VTAAEAHALLAGSTRQVATAVEAVRSIDACAALSALLATGGCPGVPESAIARVFTRHATISGTLTAFESEVGVQFDEVRAAVLQVVLRDAIVESRRGRSCRNWMGVLVNDAEPCLLVLVDVTIRLEPL